MDRAASRKIEKFQDKIPRKSQILISIESYRNDALGIRLSTNGSKNLVFNNIFRETEKSELEYAQVHQISKRIKVGDLYLLQLYPSSELSSECVPLSDTVQPICLEQDPLQVGSNRARASLFTWYHIFNNK